jgi:hypothetical protein
MVARARLLGVLVALGAVFCFQGFSFAQTTGGGTDSSGSATLGSYTDTDKILNSVPSQGTTKALKIGALSGSGTSNGIPSNTITNAILPYLAELFATFRFMALLWLLIMTIVIGMGFALQQSKLEDLVHGIFGGAIVIGAQIFAGIFIGTLPTQ